MFKHLSVKMLQGSKGGSIAVEGTGASQYLAPGLKHLCVLELKLASGSCVRAHALGHMPFLSGFSP